MRVVSLAVLLARPEPALVNLLFTADSLFACNLLLAQKLVVLEAAGDEGRLRQTAHGVYVVIGPLSLSIVMLLGIEKLRTTAAAQMQILMLRRLGFEDLAADG